MTFFTWLELSLSQACGLKIGVHLYFAPVVWPHAERGWSYLLERIYRFDIHVTCEPLHVPLQQQQPSVQKFLITFPSDHKKKLLKGNDEWKIWTADETKVSSEVTAAEIFWTRHADDPEEKLNIYQLRRGLTKRKDKYYLSFLERS